MLKQIGTRKRKARALESSRSTIRARFEAAWVPCDGECPICEGGGLPGRHRIIDEIRSRSAAGDSVVVLAAEYARSQAAIRLVLKTSLRIAVVAGGGDLLC